MATSHTSLLKADYPWTSSPLIVSAPMRLISTAPLASSVSRAGGLGFLAAGSDLSNMSVLVEEATSQCSVTSNGTLDIGIGFLNWGASLSTAKSVLSAMPHPPAALWFFAPAEAADLALWTNDLRTATRNKSKIWIQVGTVSSALQAASSCKPDVLVIQGADAGGHGLAHSCSIISLLPEVYDALHAGGHGHIPLVAAGGISDGRGVAAALMLGASGVCMGTRFLCTPEAVISEGYKNALIAASDGGVKTVRTSVYDQLRGTAFWPEGYNGRGVINASFQDAEAGMDEAHNKKLYEEAVNMGDAGWGEKGRMTTYAGTAVGLVKEVKPAAIVVKEVIAASNALLNKVFE